MSGGEQQYDAPALLAQALHAMENCKPDLARKFLLRALETDPNHVESLEALGVAEMDAANEAANDAEGGAAQMKIAEEAAERARACFLKAAQLRPELGHEKFLYLGQLSAGKEAVEFYRTGVMMAEKELAAMGPGMEEEASSLRRKISAALCSMTEIYMTDCCDEPEAESCCEEFTSTAIRIDPTNPEAYQTLASVRMSQCRPEDARSSIVKSMELWADTEPGDPSHPAYPARVALVKILLELGEHERALSVLHTLELENDEDPEGWYLWGWCYYRMGGGGDDEGTSTIPNGDRLEHWDNARDCFEKVIQLHQKFGTAEEELIAHTTELLNEIQPFLKVPRNPSEPIRPDGDEVEDWEDSDVDMEA
ncbi:hypothetical protein HK104_002557 [Borealophlyctis nickersoniae]|nr:hypothetical protein HK104_002557 [Borealophlyctis nickersoniae]